MPAKFGGTNKEYYGIFRSGLYADDKSEIVWLGSMRNRKDTILDLEMSSEPVYALGVHFTHDLEVSEKKIFLQISILKENNEYVVPKRLSILGKINIIKTLALSKLIFIYSVLNTPIKNSVKK